MIGFLSRCASSGLPRSINRINRGLLFAISGMLLCTAHVRGDIISVGGPVYGWSGAEGLAVGWSMNFDTNATISVPLGNGNGVYPAIDNTAYLISGSLPNLSDIVATTNFTLPGYYDGTFTLFSDISLTAGDYWLLLASPGPPSSYANWAASNPAIITTAPGVQYLGFVQGFDGDGSFEGPWDSPFAYQFT